MKNVHWFLAALLLTAACGSEDTTVAAATRSAEVRLRGIGGAAFGAVLLEVKDISVTADGVPLAVSGGQTRIDLANTDHAWLLGAFDLPVDATRIEVAITLDDFGGYEGTIGAGALDLRMAPIRFEGSVAQFTVRGKATLQVDLRRAIVPVAPERAVMLPVATAAF